MGVTCMYDAEIGGQAHTARVYATRVLIGKSRNREAEGSAEVWLTKASLGGAALQDFGRIRLTRVPAFSRRPSSPQERGAVTRVQLVTPP